MRAKAKNDVNGGSQKPKTLAATPMASFSVMKFNICAYDFANTIIICSESVFSPAGAALDELGALHSILCFLGNRINFERRVCHPLLTRHRSFCASLETSASPKSPWFRSALTPNAHKRTRQVSVLSCRRSSVANDKYEGGNVLEIVKSFCSVARPLGSYLLGHAAKFNGWRYRSFCLIFVSRSTRAPR